MKKLTILCPFCNAPYTAKMLSEFENDGFDCDTCGPGERTCTLDIVCTNCNKSVYIKEFREYGNS